jgi:hypothetical protein
MVFGRVSVTLPSNSMESSFDMQRAWALAVGKEIEGTESATPGRILQKSG